MNQKYLKSRLNYSTKAKIPHILLKPKNATNQIRIIHFKMPTNKQKSPNTPTYTQDREIKVILVEVRRYIKIKN